MKIGGGRVSFPGGLSVVVLGKGVVVVEDVVDCEEVEVFAVVPVVVRELVVVEIVVEGASVEVVNCDVPGVTSVVVVVVRDKSIFNPNTDLPCKKQRIPRRTRIRRLNFDAIFGEILQDDH